ncbi:hypothetical protein DFJ73DRAFT_792867 [Zopfochytrium polystomum]|nr:hypothetical protein DFJ73DRAFT_792867 [Zopfochytrium polystomum]
MPSSPTTKHPLPHPASSSFALATLLRLPMLQAASFRALHPLEFDAAVAAASNEKTTTTALLDLLWRYCHARGLPPRYSRNAVTHPCATGRLDVLRWWRRTAAGLDVLAQHAADGIQTASRSGRVDVLDWWLRESGVSLTSYDTRAVDFACCNGHVDVLRWWRDSSGLAMRYSAFAVEFAARAGRVDAVRAAVRAGRVEVLEFWLESGWERFLSAKELVDEANRCGHPRVVKWAVKNESLWASW